MDVAMVEEFDNLFFVRKHNKKTDLAPCIQVMYKVVESRSKFEASSPS